MRRWTRRWNRPRRKKGQSSPALVNGVLRGVLRGPGRGHDGPAGSGGPIRRMMRDLFRQPGHLAQVRLATPTARRTADRIGAFRSGGAYPNRAAQFHELHARGSGRISEPAQGIALTPGAVPDRLSPVPVREPWRRWTDTAGACIPCRAEAVHAGRSGHGGAAGDDRCWTPAPRPAARAAYMCRGHERHRPGVRLGRARAPGGADAGGWASGCGWITCAPRSDDARNVPYGSL